MKNFFKLISILILLVLIVLATKNYIYLEENIEFEEDTMLITKYYIYGTHLNIEGNIENVEFDEIKLILKNRNKELEYDLIIEDNNFKTSFNSNEGINLEEINENFYFAIKTIKDNKIKYYKLENNTNYETTNYYTFKNKKLTLYFNNTLKIKAFKSKEEIYDVVLDAGHGGKDTGAQSFSYNESDLTTEYIKALKDKLEENNIKVKLTREDNETIDAYGENSRTSIPYESHAKYLFSVHFNSSETPIYRGIEIYSPPHINYDFAKELVNSITNNTSINISNNKSYQIDDGICVRTLVEENIENMKKEAKENDFEPYDIKDNTPYLYMIRETGGIIMNAYVDGRDNTRPKNIYKDSNIAPESYLLELGYLNNYLDLEIILNEKDKYIEAIANTIISKIKK